MVMNFVNVFLRTLLGHEAYPEALAKEVFSAAPLTDLEAQLPGNQIAQKTAVKLSDELEIKSAVSGNGDFGSGGCTTDCLMNLHQTDDRDTVGRCYRFPPKYFHPVRAERSSGIMNHAIKTVQIFLKHQDGLGTEPFSYFLWLSRNSNI